MTEEQVYRLSDLVEDVINSELRVEKVVAFGKLDLLTDNEYVLVELEHLARSEDYMFLEKDEPFKVLINDGQVTVIFNATKCSVTDMKHIYLKHYYEQHRKKVNGRKAVIKYVYPELIVEER